MAATKKSATGSSDQDHHKGGDGAAQNKGLMKPMQPDEALAAIVGHDPLPRTEITKKVWDYIKRHNLQDAKNKRLINADDRLQSVFGGKQQVTMFELTKLLNQHIK